MFRHYLVMALGEDRAPIPLLYDNNGEELSFLQMYLGQVHKIKSRHLTLFSMASSEIYITKKETRTETRWKAKGLL